MSMLEYTPKTLRMDFTEDFDVALKWAKKDGYVGVHEKLVESRGILDQAFSGASRGGPRVSVFFKDGTRDLYYDYGDFHYGADFHDYRDRFLFATRLSKMEKMKAGRALSSAHHSRCYERTQGYSPASPLEVLRKVYIPRVGEDEFRQRWEEMGHAMEDVLDDGAHSLGYSMAESIGRITGTDPEMWRRMDREWDNSELGRGNRKRMRKTRREYDKWLRERAERERAAEAEKEKG